MPFHTKAERKKKLEKLRRIKVGLKKDFITLKKAPSVGEKIGGLRKKLGKKINTPKFRKIRKFSGERGRSIGESLGRPVRFDMF